MKGEANKMADIPVKHYDGNFITCYPGSNQKDEGKFNMEFNMARLVTRVTSKNFCITKPSYELKAIRGSLGTPQVRIGEGQCSINGMDLIMTSTLDIDVPQDAGTYYLVFKLWRDGSNNVKGDEIYGASVTFQGLYVTWVDEKPDPVTDPDIFYLGRIVYDGTAITELEEDEDKYGRIWAEDILAKIKDPKHPDITRLLLQDWIYYVPDWYVSKEGDVEFEAIEWLPGRQNGDYTSEDYGTGKYGIHIKAVDDNNSEMILKAPIINEADPDKVLKAFATNQGIELNIGKSKLLSNTTNNFALALTTPNNILVNSDGNVSLIGKTEISLGTGANGTTPKYLLKDNKATLSSTLNSGLKDEVVFSSNALQHIVGKSIFQYANNMLSLLGNDTTHFNISPNLDALSNGRVKGTLYIGDNATYGNDPTYLQKQRWQISDGSNTNVLTPTSITIQNSNDSQHAKLLNDGKLELKNGSAPAEIYMLDGGGYSVSLKQTSGAKGDGTGAVSILDVTAGHTKFSGDVTATGDIRANKVYNAVYNGFGEIFRKSIDEEIEYGDIVCVRKDGLVHKVSSIDDINNIIGVCSNTIGIEMGGKDIPKEEQVEVEMVGQIWVKTDNLNIKCGQWVKALPNGKCDITTNKQDRLGITISTVIDNKVRIVYNG